MEGLFQGSVSEVKRLLGLERDEVVLLEDADAAAEELLVSEYDAEDVRVLDGSSLEARIKLRIAVVSSTLKTRLAIVRTAPPNRATLVAEGSGSGSSMNVTSVFELSGESPTTMHWSADAEMTGVMAGIGSTLLKGFATKKVAEIFTGITSAVEAAI